MKFKRITPFQYLYYKLFDKKGYKRYKDEKGQYKFYKKTIAQPALNLQHADKPILSFKHSGNSGDIIYSLPVVFELAKQAKVHFYLHSDQVVEHHYDHPLGTKMLNEKMVSMLQPLLMYQPKIEQCELYKEQEIDYDLDLFRKISFPADRGSISRWYMFMYAVFPDLSKPWLVAPTDETYKNTIVIARSKRYRAPGISYDFLQKYPDKIFVGVAEEYEEMKQVLPGLVYQPVNDFLELATIINSCRFFIGNQSFPFSIAEGLKAKRVLEVFHSMPNVIVHGKGGCDFVYQPQFEKIVDDLYNGRL